jgi:hypothetical protein
VFDAAAAVPALSVVEHTTDGVGRPGIGIARSTDGKSGTIVFDAQTFEYLGFRQGAHASAEVGVAIVDDVGRADGGNGATTASLIRRCCFSTSGSLPR